MELVGRKRHLGLARDIARCAGPDIGSISSDWWFRRNAIERAEDAEIAAGAQTAWRFMAIDLDGSYFDATRFDDRIASTRLFRKGYMRAEGQSDADYARVLEEFIANMIVIDHRVTRWPHRLVGVGDAAHKSKFEIVAARDSNGDLITVPYPGSWQDQSTGNGLEIPVSSCGSAPGRPSIPTPTMSSSSGFMTPRRPAPPINLPSAS